MEVRVGKKYVGIHTNIKVEVEEINGKRVTYQRVTYQEHDTLHL